MPDGIVTTIEDGFAIVDFVDPSKRGPGLRRLIELYGPEVIETLTRTGPRRLYRIPEGNASAAGLLDAPVEAPPVEYEAPVTGPNYDDGFPDADWHRGALNEYAAKLGIENPTKLPNKAAVLKAINDVL